MTDSLLIIDFGSQVTQLIARRLRELHYFTEIVPSHSAPEILSDPAALADVKGIILSGGPQSVTGRYATRSGCCIWLWCAGAGDLLWPADIMRPARRQG